MRLDIQDQYTVRTFLQIKTNEQNNQKAKIVRKGLKILVITTVFKDNLNLKTQAQGKQMEKNSI